MSGTHRAKDGPVDSPIENITFSVYRDERGGTPLWQETQNVNLDGNGNYSALIGSTQSGGVPEELFRAAEPRWLGIQFNRPGELEQARVLLVSVPYAYRADDADRLGGHPASAYLLASPDARRPDNAHTEPAANHPSSLTPRAAAGSPGYIAQFLNATDLGNSLIVNAGGNLGIGTATPIYTVDVLGVGGRFSSLRVGNATNDTRLRIESTYSSALGMKNGPNGLYGWMGVTGGGDYQFSDQQGNSLVVIQQAGNMGVGTAAPGSRLDVAGDINLTGAIRFQGNKGMSISIPTGNTSMGYLALGLNTTGTNNSAHGFNALAFNTTGQQNTASGGYALFSNTAGNFNTAQGYGVLQSNGTGDYNTAAGYNSLAANLTGHYNTAHGALALQSNDSGNGNAAIGFMALANNSSGSQNVAGGSNALLNNSTGTNNIAVGYQAGSNIINSYNIDIGNQGTGSDSGVIRLGDALHQSSFFAAGVRGVTTARNDAVPVFIDSAGQLGTIVSSRRFKEDIRSMGVASSGLMRLRPVTFRYRKPSSDGSKPLQYGLIAEEVAEIYPDLVSRSADGQIETVKYQVLDSMLLNEVQRQEKWIRKLETEIGAQQAQIALQQEQIRSLTGQLAKMEATLESVRERSRVP